MDVIVVRPVGRQSKFRMSQLITGMKARISVSCATAFRQCLLIIAFQLRGKVSSERIWYNEGRYRHMMKTFDGRVRIHAGRVIDETNCRQRIAES